jgi:regulator of sigma E protease
MNWLTPTLILEFIIGLVLLIIIHEFGHFIAARLSKVGVDEFGVGFPPRLARLFTWSGTEFSLNWIPLGGFVRLKGEGDPSVEGGLAAANPWVRLIVYLAGPMANLLVGALLFTLVFAQLGMIPDMRSVQLDLVEPGSPAENAGLLVDDIVKSADGQLISTTEQLRTIIYSHLGEPFEIVLVRNGEEIAVVVTPRAEVEPGQGALGVVMGNPSRPFSLGAGLAAGFNQIAEYTRSLVDVGGKLVSRQATSEDVGLVGIVGMGEFYVEMRQSEPAPGVPRSVSSLAFFATISVSLGLLNLLPIPALDGGRILLTLPELITGRRVPPKYESWINGASLALLLILLIYINLRDVFNVFFK